MTLKRFSLKKRYYVVLVSRDEGGGLRKIPVPLHYAYVFIAAAVIGTFTVAGLAGDYLSGLVKLDNQLLILLDIDKIFGDEEIDPLKNAVAAE